MLFIASDKPIVIPISAPLEECRKLSKYRSSCRIANVGRICYCISINKNERVLLRMRKILIADGCEEFRLALADALQGEYIVQLCADGNQAVELLSSFSPDIFVLDLMVAGKDGLAVLQEAAALQIHPTILATSRFLSDYVMEAASRLGVEYLAAKPCDPGSITARIRDLSRQNQPMLLHPLSKRSAVSNMLLELNMPTKRNGFIQSREAVLLLYQDRRQSITKQLYPQVGALCDASAIQVERSIRSAIAAAWRNRDEAVWRKYFAPGPNGQIPRPTNAAFLSRLADALELMLEQSAERIG